MTAQADALATMLFELEQQLMQPEIRRDRERASALLHEEFREFGSSGREWSREAILDLLEQEANQLPPEVLDFAVRLLSPIAALVTYRAARASSTSLRSSLWVGDDSGWRLLFHQGTRVASGYHDCGRLVEALDIAADAAGQYLDSDAERDER